MKLCPLCTSPITGCQRVAACAACQWALRRELTRTGRCEVKESPRRVLTRVGGTGSGERKETRA